MKPQTLSPEIKKRIDMLFDEENREDVYRLMLEECNSIPGDLERCQFAALKISEGSVDRLLDALELAQTDQKDLLVSAGFAKDINAHKKWMPRK